MAATEPVQLGGAVAGVADEDEPPVREHWQHGAQQRGHDLCWRALRAVAGPVGLLRAVEVHEHRQGPGAGGPGETDERGQDDPPAAVPPGGVAVGRAARVAVAGLAMDLSPGVSLHYFVSDQGDGAVVEHVGQDEPAEASGQPNRRPRG